MSHPEYDLKTLNLPRLAGLSLELVTVLTENRFTRGLISRSLFANGGITAMRQLEIADPPTFEPGPPPSLIPFSQAEPDLSPVLTQAEGRNKAEGFQFTSILDYAQAYRSGEQNPIEVAERILAAIQASNGAQPPLRAIIACQKEDVLAQAEASARRFQAGKPLSPLDGVPVAVKDELDQVPYGTTDGTSFFGKTPAGQDAASVARLRSAGALLIGKANMHEIGIGVTGFNSFHGTARNPYHLNHHTGGSSSGPASAVASGLAPLALGADGGGSIRIPSAFCGVVGLKPTFGRVSERGAFPTNWSVAHIGPIGATAADVALGYAILAGADPADAHTLHQPSPTLEGFERIDLSDLSLGVYDAWVQHADTEIVQAFEAALHRLQSLGARLRPIYLPELEPARVAHMVTITSEMAHGLEQAYRLHRREFSLEVRYDLALARLFTARDYLQAQRIRTRTIAHFETAFQEVDLILTPTTAVTAPPIRADALAKGESDISLLSEIMRYATPANLTGHPAISFPVGYTTNGLPIGLQAIGCYWQEHTLLRLANAFETTFERRKPSLHYPIL